MELLQQLCPTPFTLKKNTFTIVKMNSKILLKDCRDDGVIPKFGACDHAPPRGNRHNLRGPLSLSLSIINRSEL